jgi:TolB-like protein
VSFVSELRRRNVIRMAGLYLVGAWLVTQVAATVLPLFGAPDWMARSVVVVLAIGFLPALVFAWVFELTPAGLKRDAEVPAEASIGPQTGRRMDRAIIVVLLLALGYFALDKFALAPRQQAAATTRDAGGGNEADGKQAILDKSIAVLPFADFSQGGDQAWFADGLAEEILNSLARTPDLLVAARTSSFKYKGSTLAIPQIAKELGVAHVLEGSVRSGAGRVRVTAQLIRASDGFHLWSQTFDRDAADVIAIQEELARQIASAMQTSMDPQALADMAKVGTRSVEAYQAYLRGVAEASNASNHAQAFEANQFFEQARTLDPGFSAAHLRAANYWYNQLDITSMLRAETAMSPEAIRQRFRERIGPAIEHATLEVDRNASRAALAMLDFRYREAIELTRKVLAERPDDRDALATLVDLLSRTSQNAAMQAPLDKIWSRALERRDWASLHMNYAHRGPDRRRAADQALEVMRRWPDEEELLYQVQRTLLWDGRVEAAREAFERWRDVAGDVPEQASSSVIPPARQAAAEGRCDEVERLLDGLPAHDIGQRWHLLMLLDRRVEAAQVLMPLERSGNLQALAGHLNYRQFDPAPYPSLVRAMQRENIQRPPAVALPFACKRQGATP